jgi:hypothetical protein
LSIRYEKPPRVPVASGRRYPSTRSVAPTTGALPRYTCPKTSCEFDVFGFHGRITTGPCVVIRGCAVAASTRRRGVACAGAARVGVKASAAGCGADSTFRVGRLLGGGDSFCEPPSANTCSSDATPPFDDVGVPPDVIATYSLLSTE